MKLSLRNRFLVPMVAIVVIGMGFSGTISYLKAKSSLETNIHTQIQQLTNSTASAMEIWIKAKVQELKGLGVQKAFQVAVEDSFTAKAARKSINTMLAMTLKETPAYENINLAGTDGSILAAGDTSVVGKLNVKERPFFKPAMEGKVFISDVLKSRATGNPVFFISAPVKKKDAVVGIVFSVIDVSNFNTKFIDTIKIGEKGYAYAYDKTGFVIAHPDKKHILKLNMNKFDFGKKMIASKSGLIQYLWNGEEKIVSYQTEPTTGWTFAVGAALTDLLAPVNVIRNLNFGVTATAVLLSVLVILLIVRSIVRPINHIADGLNAGAEQVASGSGQVAESSQALAEGASQQAASIEETSASLEEMASMTKQNADHSHQADRLMTTVNEVVREADAAMTELTGSMDEITKASEETSKIIKTIDEIAFQTNLLALNAAVEAARAGEAGAGFAVVADEVRNLAMRAADAAKNTAELIEGTVKKIDNGTQLVTKSNEAFTKVAESSGKVGELIGEIAAASGEQAQGIDQINKAVTEMDKVVQHNAASAEESASAAEEMSAQSEEMRKFVTDMVVLVTGNKDNRPAQLKSSGRAAAPKPKAGSGSQMKPAKAEKKESADSSEDILPLEDGGFDDF